MFIGEYIHNIDAKGRLNFPSRLREELGDAFIITRGLDNCLYVYSFNEWKSLEESIKSLPRFKRRSLERFFFAGALKVIPDKQGRIIIPSALRAYASLEKEVVVIGVSDHVEIWNKGNWDTAFANLSSENITKIMDELGF